MMTLLQYSAYLALEEEVHAVPVEEALAVGWGLVGHVPHGRPGRLHYVITNLGMYSIKAVMWIRIHLD